MADIHLFGHKVSPVAAGAIVIGSVAAIWFAWRQHSASSSSSGSGGSGSTASSAIDPLTGLPTAQDSTVDPLTGMTYLAEAQQYGSVQAAEAAISGQSAGAPYSGYDYGAYGYGGYGSYGPTGTTGTTAPAAGTGYASNAQWAQAVEAGLTDLGWNPEDIAAALGRYLGNLPETASQAAIVQAALAEYGPPPTGSYQIIQRPPTGSPGSGTKVAVPDVKGVNVEQATGILHDEGLKASGPAGKKGVTHEVTGTRPAAGTKVATGSTVHLEYKTVHEQTGLTLTGPTYIPGGRGDGPV